MVMVVMVMVMFYIFPFKTVCHVFSTRSPGSRHSPGGVRKVPTPLSSSSWTSYDDPIFSDLLIKNPGQWSTLKPEMLVEMNSGWADGQWPASIPHPHLPHILKIQENIIIFTQISTEYFPISQNNISKLIKKNLRTNSWPKFPLTPGKYVECTMRRHLKISCKWFQRWSINCCNWLDPNVWFGESGYWAEIIHRNSILIDG